MRRDPAGPLLEAREAPLLALAPLAPDESDEPNVSAPSRETAKHLIGAHSRCHRLPAREGKSVPLLWIFVAWTRIKKGTAGFSNNFFRKIEARAKVRPVMTPSIDNARATQRRPPPGSRARMLYIATLFLTRRNPRQRKNGSGVGATH
jgi:hypothetical protein